jgi:hypothetical protein
MQGILRNYPIPFAKNTLKQKQNKIHSNTSISPNVVSALQNKAYMLTTRYAGINHIVNQIPAMLRVIH